jgi:hypothetical protein
MNEEKTTEAVRKIIKEQIEEEIYTTKQKICYGVEHMYADNCKQATKKIIGEIKHLEGLYDYRVTGKETYEEIYRL